MTARIREALPQGRTLSPEDWRRRHRAIAGLLWLHVPALFVFALVRGNPLGHSLFEASVVASFAVAAIVAMPHSRRAAATVASLGLLTASAVLVHLSGGTIEAHFHFFVMVTVLVLYEDWLPFLAAIAYVVLQHGMAGVIDPSSVYNHMGAKSEPWKWAGIHGFFILCLSIANIVSWRLNEASRARMHASETRVREAFDMAPIGIALVGPDGRFHQVNSSLCELSGFSEEELLERGFEAMTPPEDLERDREGLEWLYTSDMETYRGEKRFLRREGDELWAEIALSVQRDAEGRMVQCVVQYLDLTERKRAADMLAHQALHDSLTGLPNHTRFREEVESAAAGGAPFAVVVLGIDGLTAINESSGHPYGDELLRRVGSALVELAPADALVSRVAGDEFALVVPGATRERAQEAAEAARGAVAAQSAQGAEVTASAGIAAYPADADDAARLVHLTEAALHQAKREGGDRVLAWDGDRVAFSLTVAEQRREIEAILRDDGALKTVFQPLVELASGDIVGYEALARFETGQRRGPDVWFAQAHRCGLGAELEARAVELAVATPGRPDGAHLSLNLSPSALASEQIWSSLPADCSELVIEVTEHELISDMRAVVSALDELRRRGAAIAVDDTGAGYAGLQQVMRLQPDIIKLDRALTDGVSGDPAKVALIESFVRFASRTGALVCAEGIETIEDLRVLADLDVSWGQGYGLARPAEPWVAIAPEAVAACREGLDDALRTAAELGAAGEGRLERVTSGLASITSLDELAAISPMVAAELGADVVSFSVLNEGDGYVQTVGSSDWRENGERFWLDDYPLTRHALATNEACQIVARDPLADPAEVAQLRAEGFESLLMIPMISHGRPLGLLEAYSSRPRSWTRAQINRGRIVCNQFAAVLESFGARQVEGA